MGKRKIAILMVFILLFSILSGCSNNNSSTLSGEKFQSVSFEKAKDSLKSAEDSLKCLNDMGYAITKDLLSNTNENIIFSPLSLTSALAMLYNGAEGETAKQLNVQLGAEKDTLNNTYNLLLNLLENYSEKKDVGAKKKMQTTIIKTANSAWFNKDISINKDFVDSLKKYYDADTMNVDFGDVKTKDSMNKWIEDKTNNILKNTIDKTEPDDIAYLVNTLYFKGTWRDEFNKDVTSKKPFYLENGEETSVDMMFAHLSKQFYEDDICKIIALDYYDATMYVVLPKADLKSFIESDKYKEIDKMIEKMEYTGQIEVSFPKFEYKNSNNLNEQIKNIGITNIFDGEKAELNKIADLSPDNLFVNRIFQNASIAVDEVGTEAAAVTVIEMKCTGVPAPEEKKTFNCNKPFIYVIKDDCTGINFFTGVVQNPNLK